MKKILFSLVALVCSMSMNAQVMKVMKGNEVVATYTADQADNVVFEEAQGSTTTGTAKRTGDIEVNWVQLWENGPKFAEYNVGAANDKAEDYGGYYAWGGSQDKVDDHNTGTEVLTGNNDTATKLWGSNWRMPTKSEIQALYENCDAEQATVNGVNGIRFTGKADAYKSNSVFLPASGRFDGSMKVQGSYGYIWTSTPYSTDNTTLAYQLYMGYASVQILTDNMQTRSVRIPVRAVLAE